MSKVDTTTKFTLTHLTEYLNANFKKEKQGRQHVSPEFTLSDVQGYIAREQLPLYIHEVPIKVVLLTEIPGVKLYRLQEILSDEEKADRITEILASGLLKKDKIVALAEIGITRSEVIKLGFTDNTYIYDLYRDKFPELCI